MTEKPDVTTLLPDEATLAARRLALEAELRPARRSRRLRPPSRRLAVALVALVALGGGGAWAAGAFSAEEISYQAGVGCYSEARLHGPRLSVTVTHAAADPVAKCERYWREGMVDSTQRRLGREGKIDYTPHLVACARPGSGVAVFPGSEKVCERFGLQPLPEDYEAPGREAARAYTAWNRVLARRFMVLEAGRCLCRGSSNRRTCAASRRRGSGCSRAKLWAEPDSARFGSASVMAPSVERSRSGWARSRSIFSGSPGAHARVYSIHRRWHSSCRGPTS